jgi:CRISPR-associated protein Cas1
MSSVDDFIGSERVLEVSSRCHIRFEANSFVVESREENRRSAVPSGDVLALVLESEFATISAAALAACGERGIAAVVCQHHKPVALSLPIDAGWNSAEMRRLQARALRGEAAARRLWRRTVRAKIFAQAALIEQLGGDGARRVRRLADQVELDGQETTEAQAASIYWRALFADFERSDQDDPRNGLLNWGYAVLLATIGRGLVALGFDPALGFGHNSRTNSWALACDLMEPFRPTIDAAVAFAIRASENEDGQAIKSAILRPFANDGPVKQTILEVVRGYRDFLDDGNETRVRYPDRPLLA